MNAATTVTVRVLVGKSGDTVGSGWLVSHERIVTCAHVVNNALGRDQSSPEKPDDNDRIMVRMPIKGVQVKKQEISCIVSYWEAPCKSALGGFEHDIAHLTPAESNGTFLQPPSVLTSAPPQGEEAFRCFGYPSGSDTGRSGGGKLGALAGRRFELLQDGEPNIPEPGFSGAPVFVQRNVVGIVSSVSADSSIAYLTPVESCGPAETLPPRLSASAAKFSHVSRLLDRISKIDRRKSGEDFDLRARQRAASEANETAGRIGSATDYTAADLTPETFFNTHAGPRALLLSAPGGSGKTHFLIDVARYGAAIGNAPFWLDLSKANDGCTDEQTLFDKCTVSGAYADVQRIRDARDKVLIIADGLNERSGNRDTVAALLERISVLTSSTVIVGDRLTRRAPDADFDHVTMVPLSLLEISENISRKPDENDKWMQLLGSPFFLALYVAIQKQDGGDNPQRVELISRYFATHAFEQAASESKIDTLAAPAFNVYRDSGNRAASRSTWTAAGFADEALKELVSSGTLREDPSTGEIEFSHQLFHDWLAAKHVANSGAEAWINGNFDAITLKKASIDAVGLTAEMIPEEHLTDFLIAAYDWDYSAVLKVIADFELGRHGDSSPVSRGFRDAIFALNALRASDFFQHTRDAVAPLLGIYCRLDEALEINENPTAEEVFKAYSAKYGKTTFNDQRLEEFRDMFLSPEIPQNQAMEKLSSDPFIGWSAANKLRLSEITDDFVTAAKGANAVLSSKDVRGQQSSVGTRWRIVHVLGVAKQNEVTDFLFDVLLNEDDDDWVRFGAARSLMEKAGRTSDTNEQSAILKRATSELKVIEPRIVRGEFRNATKVAKEFRTTDYWYPQVLDLLKEGKRISAERNEPDAGLWESRLNEIGVLAGKQAKTENG